MFRSRGINNKINRMHERVLIIIYKDKSSTFQELLQKGNSVSIHHTQSAFNCSKLTTETLEHGVKHVQS